MPNAVRETASPRIRARREGRRREILEAAWDLARRDGLALVSLRDLAGAVGMRAPSLYEYFASKDAIYDAMFAQGWTTLDARLRDIRLTGDRAADVLVSIEVFLDFCAEDHARYQLLFTRAVPGWEPSADAYAVSVTAYEGMVDRLAALGLTDPAMVDLLTALSSGLAAQQAANDPGGERYRRLAPDAVQMYLAHIDRAAPPHTRTPEETT